MDSADLHKSRDRQAQEKKHNRPQLIDEQREAGFRFLREPDLIERIAAGYDTLGYVQEHKNKIPLYLVMTLRLMDNPLHAIAVSRGVPGKSLLTEITESLCPPEDAESISDL